MSVTFRNTPKSKERRGGLGGGRGLRSRQTPTSLEQASAAAARGHVRCAKMAGSFDRIGHVSA